MIFQLLAAIALGHPVEIPNGTDHPAMIHVMPQHRQWDGRQMYWMVTRTWDGYESHWEWTEFGCEIKEDAK